MQWKLCPSFQSNWDIPLMLAFLGWSGIVLTSFYVKRKYLHSKIISHLLKVHPALLLAKVFLGVAIWWSWGALVNRAEENHKQWQCSILTWCTIYIAGHCADALTYSAELNRTRKCHVLTRQLPVPGWVQLTAKCLSQALHQGWVPVLKNTMQYADNEEQHD